MMRNIFLASLLSLLIATILIPAPTLADVTGSVCPTGGIVTCSGTPDCPCTWDKVGLMLSKILDFFVNDLAIPLATIAIIIGAVLMLISAGNPKLAGMGKSILWSAIIGLLLALCARLIINWILLAVGYKGGGL